MKTAVVMCLALILWVAVPSGSAQFSLPPGWTGGTTLPWYPPESITFIELDGAPFPNDLHVLDMLIRAQPERIRFFRTTNGNKTTNPTVVTPGELLGVDVVTPIPLLEGLDGFDGVGWQLLGSPPPWIQLDPVARWSEVFGTTDGKGNSQQGMESREGTLFVTTRQLSSPTENGPRWNGLSRVSGTATPSRAFAGTDGELYSTAPTTGEAGGPEGNAIGMTLYGDSFEFVPNYDGADAAGLLHVQVITNLGSPDSAECADIDLVDMLGVYSSNTATFGEYGQEVPRHWFDGPGSSSSPGDKLRGTFVLVVNGDDSSFPNAGKTFLVNGLDLDPVWPPMLEGAVDTDPVEIGIQPGFDVNNDYAAVDGSSWVDGPTGTRDDGKYDYIAFTDITNMWGELVSGTGSPGGGSGTVEFWSYADPAAWREHTTFLRLPGDFPAFDADNWDVQLPCDPIEWVNRVGPTPCPSTPFGCGDYADFGRDWSGVPPACAVAIWGSGTICSITAHPDGTFLYVLTDDEDVDAYYETPLPPMGPDIIADRDGGWHLPHLYSIDLSQVDLTVQSSLDYYAVVDPASAPPGAQIYPLSWLEPKRLHKVAVVRQRVAQPTGPDILKFEAFITPSIYTSNPWETQKWLAGLDEPGVLGSAYIASEQLPPYSPSGIPPSASWENYYEPTPRTRLLVGKNESFTAEPNRMFMGVNGWILDGDIPYLDKYFNAGAILALGLPSAHNSFGQTSGLVSGLPHLRSMVTLPFKDNQLPLASDRTFIVAGMSILPVTDEVIAIPGEDLEVSTRRIILGVLGRDRRDVFVPVPLLQHRLFLIQEPGQ